MTAVAAGVAARVVDGTLHERYRYAPGPAQATPPHVHDEYQLCLSVDFPGEYRYRGAAIPVPSRAVSILHPGEPHASRDPLDRRRPSTYLLAYIGADAVAAVAAELAGRDAGTAPFFERAVVVDRELALRFAAMHAAAFAEGAGLAYDVERARLLESAIRRCAPLVGAREPRRARENAAVARAREYLHEHHAERVRLADLAAEAGLSPWHLSRVFARTVGVPPHRYQLHVRLEAAKRMLLAGVSHAQTAAATGFADQGHFSRRFRAYVGFPPSAYRLA
jgi:AraC-like DNA-binding protein